MELTVVLLRDVEYGYPIFQTILKCSKEEEKKSFLNIKNSPKENYRL